MKKLKNILLFDYKKNIYILEKNIQNILDNINERNPVKVRSNTPKELIDLGVKDLPIYENSFHIRKNILTEQEAINKGLIINSRDHYHGLGKDIYIRAIYSLDNPRVIFQNKKDYFILTTLKDINNNNIVIPIEVNTVTYINRNKIDINRVKSVYGYKTIDNISLNDYIKYNIKNKKFIKVYEQKKEQGTGFSTAAGSSSNNISQCNKKVNININTCTIDDLMEIKGIGKAKAEAIIEYRNNNGNFKSIEDIKSVSGIGESLFEKIKEYITV